MQENHWGTCPHLNIGHALAVHLAKMLAWLFSRKHALAAFLAHAWAREYSMDVRLPDPDFFDADGNTQRGPAS